MTRVPLRLVWLGTVVSLAADAWFAAMRLLNRVLSRETRWVWSR